MRRKEEREMENLWKTVTENVGFIVVIAITAAVLFAAYQIHPAAGIIAESIMTYQMLATKCLKTESHSIR